VLACKSRDGRVDAPDLCARLLSMDVTGILLEGGSRLNGAFVDAGLVDRVAVFIAPLLVGGEAAPTAVAGHGRALSQALRLSSVVTRALRDDWLLEGDVEPDRGR
jgi:diaminohydroxyphosphoribosylaminopyrimidine deaminase/5-amino-6-(5-phosphoribosylamino)uracil reductase